MRTRFDLLAAVIAALLLATAPSLAAPCEALVHVNVGRNPDLGVLPAFCRVEGVLKPTPSSNIRFEVWLPESGWNQRLQVVGNGGLAGSISYAAMAGALREGFATASTDTGHTDTEPVRAVVAAEKGLESTQMFFRALFVPGFYHCSGGPGPIAFGTSTQPPEGQRHAGHDNSRALQRWVENDEAPTRIIATKSVDADPAKGVALQRPLGVYPQVARYRGACDVNDAASVVCETPR